MSSSPFRELFSVLPMDENNSGHTNKPHFTFSIQKQKVTQVNVMHMGSKGTIPRFLFWEYMSSNNICLLNIKLAIAGTYEPSHGSTLPVTVPFNI